MCWEAVSMEDYMSGLSHPESCAGGEECRLHDRIAALERELLAENTRYVLCSAGWKKTNEILDEAHAAIRAVPNMCSCSGGAGICAMCVWSEQHAPAIKRASDA